MLSKLHREDSSIERAPPVALEPRIPTPATSLRHWRTNKCFFFSLFFANHLSLPLNPSLSLFHLLGLWYRPSLSAASILSSASFSVAIDAA